VLVADEPTGDLDAHNAEEILGLMELLNRDFRKTIVMVTHDPRAAARAHEDADDSPLIADSRQLIAHS
jgi:putative ABC transport system ATP-binding protein